MPTILRTNVGWRRPAFVGKMSRSMHVLCAMALLATLAAAGCRKAAPPPARPDSGGQRPGSGHGRPAQDQGGVRRLPGRWGVHGLAEVEICICKTRDSGRSCRDGADCEGQCLAEAGRDRGGRQGPPGQGLLPGRCSEFDTTFGCHHIIPEGASKRDPSSPKTPPSRFCID